MAIDINTDLSKKTEEDFDPQTRFNIQALYNIAFQSAHDSSDWDQLPNLDSDKKPASITELEGSSLSQYESRKSTLVNGNAKAYVSLFKKNVSIYAMAEADYQKVLVSEMTPDRNETELTDLRAKVQNLSSDQQRRSRALAAQELRHKQEAAAAVAGRALTSEFLEQCFLMTHLFNLTDGIDRPPKKLPGYPESENIGYSIMLDGEPFGFINKLTQNPEVEKTFLNMPTDQIASLQPSIRLFKVTPKLDEEGNETSDEALQEMMFDSHYGAGSSDDDLGVVGDLERFLGDPNSRGQGVGIKDFTFSFEGDNPYAVKKSIRGKLTLFAASFDELLRKRSVTDSDGEKSSYRYIDLALKTGGNIGKTPTGEKGKTVADNLNKLNFRLMAVVGWALPPKSSEDLVVAARDAIYDSYITLNLTPILHNFDIDDSGRVTFTINYLAYVEDFFDNPNFNIFTTLTKDNIRRKIKYKILNEDCKGDEIAELKKAEADAIADEKDKGRHSLFDDLLTTDNIMVLNLPYEEMYKFTTQGPYHAEEYNPLTGRTITELEEDDPLVTEILAEADLPVPATPIYNVPAGNRFIRAPGLDYIGPARAGAAPPSASRRTTHRIAYFFVSDLVDIILRKIEDNFETYETTLGELEGEPVPYIDPDSDTPNVAVSDTKTWKNAVLAEKATAIRYKKEFQKFRLILGPLEIVKPTTPSGSKNINLGDIPVSVKYFLSWLNDKMEKKEKAHYSLPKFLNDFFNQCLKDYLNNDVCFGGQARQRVLLSQNVITSYKTPEESVGFDVDEATEFILQGLTVPPATPHSPVPSLRYRIPKTYTGRAVLKNLSGDRGLPGGYPKDAKNRQVNYLIYYASRSQPQERLQGERFSDENAGIYHYSIGRDRGIVKTINLTKTEAPGLAELRFEAEGYQGLTQLREVYDAKIKTFANVRAYPGVYIFVDPKGFAPSTIDYDEELKDLTKLGIGGYYMIKRSEHSFGPGYADSNIEAQWVAETNPDGTTATRKVESEGETVSPTKCQTNVEN